MHVQCTDDILTICGIFSRMGKKVKKEAEPPPKDVVSF